jgi:hypothetical protein
VSPSIIPDIIEGIAEAKGTESDELDVSIYEYVEPDAIQQLASHGTTSWTLSFELPSHNVTVTGDGLVLVDGAREARWHDDQ